MNACRFLNVFIWISVPAILSGCAHLDPPKRPLYEKTFTTRHASRAAEPQPLPAVPAPEQPYVKIISGTAVESPEEARRKLMEQAASRPAGLDQAIGSLKLRGIRVETLAELLTEAYDYNVVATRNVAERAININLRNISLRTAIESICRLNDLWYREGEGIITLMTRDEYLQDVQIRQAPQTRAFFIRYTNAADMAKVIQASMGEEVYLAAIDDEEIYGHLDPDEDVEVDEEYDGPELKDTRIRRGDASGGPQAARGAGPGPGPGPASAPAAGAISYESVFASSGEKKSESEEPVLARLTVFKRNNCIIARSLDENLLNEIGRTIEALDTPTNQVLLEVKILQLNISDGFESFFDFNFSDGVENTLSALGTKTVGTTTLNYLFSGDKIQTRMALYENEGRLEVISTPFLMAANNSKVEFFVGEDTPLRGDVTSETVSIGDSGETSTVFTQEIDDEELGTDVEMTTFINEDGTVTLDFEAEISSALLAYSTVQVVNDVTGDVLEYPIDGTSKSEIKAVLSARSGQSIAIGGIINETIDDSISKVPLLGNIPGLGFFFREVDKTKKKTETVIILTPHVIVHPALAGQVSAEFLERKSSHEQITSGRENILEEKEGAASE